MHAITFWWSDDDGVTLHEVTVDSDPLERFYNPSLVPWPDGRLVLFYLKTPMTASQVIHYATSGNGGRTWITGGTLSVLNPPIDGLRARLDPIHQILYLFYYGTQTHDLRLSRFGSIFDGGDGNPLESTPIIIFTGTPTFEPPDVFWDGRGGLTIGFLVGCTPVQFRSRDFGRTWTQVGIFAPDEHHRGFSTPYLGLSAHSHQAETATPYPVHCRVSEDGGISALSDTVVAILPLRQDCPVVAGNRGQLWVVTVQTVLGERVPRVYRSTDFGRTWASVTTSP